MTSSIILVRPDSSLSGPHHQESHKTVITVGLVLLILGFLLGIPLLWSLGVIVLVVGLILMLFGATGRAIGGRRHYW